MIELDIVKEQYKRMPDEELILFAKNESQHLTIESFHLLVSEFELRNLDIGVLESVEIDKALSDLNKQSAFEKSTAIEYTEMIWKFAFDEKEKGSKDSEIFKNLVKKGVDDSYAYILIESLESKSKEMSEEFDTEIILGWVFLFAGILLVFLVINGSFRETFVLYGLLFIVGGIVRLFKSYSKKNKYVTILKNITKEKEETNTLYQ